LAAGTYVCTITDANGAVITKTFVITESPLIPTPTANAGPATDSICAGFTYTSTGSASNGSILWTTSGSGIFTDATIANAVYNPSAADIATGSVQLTMTVIAPGSCNVPTATDSVVVTIYPTSNAGLISGATSVCQGVNSTTLTLSEYTGTIQWQVSTDNIVFNNIPSATASTYTATNLVATTYYRAIVTSGVCSSATTATATINVSATSVAGTISGAAPVCYGTNSTTLTLAGNVGTIQWQSSTDNINFTSISGATAATYTATNLTVTTYYRAVSTSGVCSAATTATTVVVNPLPVSNAGPVTATICAGTTYTTSGVATNGTALWSTSGTGTFADATNPVTTYTPSSADQTNGSVVLTMLVTGSASGCTSNTATDAIILAINSPAAPSANANQNYCYLNNPTVANLVTTSATNVQWYAVPTGGVALSTSTPLVTGTTYYATQTVSGCESITRTAVSIILTCSVNAVVDNLAPINGYTGGTTTSVLSNDLMNGSTLVPSNVILTGTSVPTGFTFNANGTVTIPAGTPAGNYQLTYSICELLNPSNCSQAIATIVVAPAVIDAVTDNYGMMNGFIGSVTTSVLENDLLNGALVIPSEITLTVVSIPTGLVMNPNGTITILPGTPPGIYVVTYSISENLNPTNIDQTTAVVTVVDCLAFPLNDCDGDGVTNGQEIIDGTNPSDSCSMVYTHQTLPSTSAWNNLDCDGDGVLNGQEIVNGTNPTDLCSFILASQTTATSANWNNSDCDGDGVKNGQEMIDGTNPLDLCSFNSIHITATTSTAWNNLDCDGDGVTNGQEIIDGTNPLDLCSLNPNHQTASTSTAWNNADCDGDGVTNNQEIIDQTNLLDPCSLVLNHQSVTPTSAWLNADCDGDGVTNGQEVIDGTNVNNSCDSNSSHVTLPLSQNFLAGDCDGDGLSNGEEIGSTPSSPNDFDNNNIPDYLEYNNHTASEDDLEIYNAVTPNGNGDNDVFVIRNIELYPNNTVTIFNRWGVVVYEVDSYGQNNKFFKGISEGRTTLRQLEELPIGTYFYTLRYVNSQGVQKSRSGYLYLNK
jgi:gliding motility-associated-like protein